MQNFEIEKKSDFREKFIELRSKVIKKFEITFFFLFFVLFILSLTLVVDNRRSKGNFYRQITWKRGFIFIEKVLNSRLMICIQN